jgi:hypothetical protein
MVFRTRDTTPLAQAQQIRQNAIEYTELTDFADRLQI